MEFLFWEILWSKKKTKNDFISGNLKGKFGQYEILWPIRFGENSTCTIKITYLPSLSLSLYSFVCTPTSFDGSFVSSMKIMHEWFFSSR